MIELRETSHDTREMTINTRLLLGAAGAAGAAVWALQQPLDQRVFRSGYDDVDLLGLCLPLKRGARTAGWMLHVVNGAGFGVAYSELARRTPNISPATSAMGLALLEHVALFPLGAIVDRKHPRRDQLAPIFGWRQFLQATWRHAILGAVLGAAASRLLKREQ
ncbi:MAG: hypothetical protein ABI200_05980 [Gaiellales bacterium]